MSITPFIFISSTVTKMLVAVLVPFEVASQVLNLAKKNKKKTFIRDLKYHVGSTDGSHGLFPVLPRNKQHRTNGIRGNKGCSGDTRD